MPGARLSTHRQQHCTGPSLLNFLSHSQDCKLSRPGAHEPRVRAWGFTRGLRQPFAAWSHPEGENGGREEVKKGGRKLAPSYNASGGARIWLILLEEGKMYQDLKDGECPHWRKVKEG